MDFKQITKLLNQRLIPDTPSTRAGKNVGRMIGYTVGAFGLIWVWMTYVAPANSEESFVQSAQIAEHQ